MQVEVILEKNLGLICNDHEKCSKLMLNSAGAQQGAHKRTLASVYHLFENEGKSSMLQCPNELTGKGSSFILTDVEGKDVHVSSLCGLAKGDGLLRSQSFPPEGWYKTTSKYILRIRKAWNSEDLERHCNVSGSEFEGIRRRIIMPESQDVSLGGASPMAVDSACAFNRVPEQQQILDQPKASECSIRPPSSGLRTAGLLFSSRDSSAMTSPATTSQDKDVNAHSVLSLMRCNEVDSVCPVSSKPSIVEKSASAEGLSPVSAIPLSGKLLVCGRRREMEDTAVIIPSFLAQGKGQPQLGKQANLDWHFYGVYDGHGGSQASMYCGERLHHILAEELLKSKAFVVSDGEVANASNTDWEEMLKTAFSKMDKEVGGVCPNKGFTEDDANDDGGCLCCEDAVAPENVGTTAVVALVGLDQVVVANCGDSRAVLARGGQAIPLSRDHKPEREDETRRIEAAGGRVIAWDGFRVGGLLALSRAIGDRYLKRYVISEPDTICIQRSADDECLILATDGLWDVVNSEFACEVARKSLPALRKKYASRISKPCEDAAAAALAGLLVKLAYGRGSKDNITVLVVDLKARGKSRRG